MNGSNLVLRQFDYHAPRFLRSHTFQKFDPHFSEVRPLQGPPMATPWGTHGSEKLALQYGTPFLLMCLLPLFHLRNPLRMRRKAKCWCLFLSLLLRLSNSSNTGMHLDYVVLSLPPACSSFALLAIFFGPGCGLWVCRFAFVMEEHFVGF